MRACQWPAMDRVQSFLGPPTEPPQKLPQGGQGDHGKKAGEDRVCHNHAFVLEEVGGRLQQEDIAA